MKIKVTRPWLTIKVTWLFICSPQNLIGRIAVTRNHDKNVRCAVLSRKVMNVTGLDYCPWISNTQYARRYILFDPTLYPKGQQASQLSLGMILQKCRCPEKFQTVKNYEQLAKIHNPVLVFLKINCNINKMKWKLYAVRLDLMTQ